MRALIVSVALSILASTMGAWADSPASSTPQTPATAQSPAPSVTVAPTATAAATVTPSDADTIVCRRLDPPTGELIGDRRICLTKAEWEQRRKDAQDYLSKNSDLGNEGGMTGK